MVLMEQVIGFFKPLVPFPLLLPRLVLNLFLFLAVALLFFFKDGGRLLADGQPGRTRRLLDRRLDPLGLVIGPLIRCFGL